MAATTKQAKKRLVIVESPAKARTLEKYLGRRHYTVRASLGHVRDLPKRQLGVDIEHDFAPKYVIPKEKKQVVKELAQAARQASQLYLATDPDREGEAIAWHLLNAINHGRRRKSRPPEPLQAQRIVFHEITKNAIREAVEHPRPIDIHLVNAQQARRVMDRLVGYKLSPLLWSKVKRGLSAGRVQSVALRMVVEREREVEQFVAEEYWTVDALVIPVAPRGRRRVVPFKARVIQHRRKKLTLHTEAEAQAVVAALRTMGLWVQSVRRREVKRQPAPPFITSTLQQEAGRRFGFSARRTMRLAQQLYEGLELGKEGPVGLITYMRTDSPQVAAEAQAEVRALISDQYGTEYVPDQPRQFRSRAKRAQEAHEAIRPTTAARTPASVRTYLTSDQYRLYALIWRRFVASQMAAAILDTTTVDILAAATSAARVNGTTASTEVVPEEPDSYLLRAKGSVVRFAGFLKVYEESRDEAKEADEDQKEALPPLEVGDELSAQEVQAEQHFTQPPPRFTEATLIRALEEAGVGRPSTYAPTLSVIQERGYVQKSERRLHPTELGMVVNDLLVAQFPDVVDVSFTAKMEDNLDRIAGGGLEWTPVVAQFWGPFSAAVEAAAQTVEKVQIADEPAGEDCPQCGRPMVIKLGRFGKFIACTGFPECRFTKPLLTKIGVACPQCGHDLVARRSRKGRTFYGCSTYPACDFASWQRPVPEPCPSCGGLQTQASGHKLVCTKCGHTHVPTAAPAEEAVPA